MIPGSRFAQRGWVAIGTAGKARLFTGRPVNSKARIADSIYGMRRKVKMVEFCLAKQGFAGRNSKGPPCVGLLWTVEQLTYHKGELH